jgi:GAF domain-containing protein
MTTTLDDEVIDLRRTNAELRRMLEERGRERDEALQRETATTEVLQVINASHGDLAPVFEAMLEKAMQLADATCGYFLRLQASKYTFAAGRGLPTELAQYMEHMDQPRAEEANARVLDGQPYVQILDCKDDPAYRSGAPLRRAVVDLGGMRTGLAVPLRKNDEVLGTFSLARRVVRPFSGEQIALAQNFAAQAVIALDNARLLGELRQRTHDLQEALRYQTVTSDVLKVISQSGAALEPVLKTLVETAVRICDADKGVIVQQREGLYHLVAAVGFTAEAEEFAVQNPARPGRGTVSG